LFNDRRVLLPVVSPMATCEKYRGSRVETSPSLSAGGKQHLPTPWRPRDRECKDGVGKFCREREAVVAERRQTLDTAMTSVGQTADPQTEVAVKLVAWVSYGMLRPAPEDFAMLRLVLLALLPQIGESCDGSAVSRRLRLRSVVHWIWWRHCSVGSVLRHFHQAADCFASGEGDEEHRREQGERPNHRNSEPQIIARHDTRPPI
jgi:hypothetical protein